MNWIECWDVAAGQQQQLKEPVVLLGLLKQLAVLDDILRIIEGELNVIKT